MPLFSHPSMEAKWEDYRKKFRPNIPQDVFIEFEGMIKDFFEKKFGGLLDYIELESEEAQEQGRKLFQRIMRLMSSMSKSLDEFYEEHERFKETGDFEIIWADIIIDEDNL